MTRSKVTPAKVMANVFGEFQGPKNQVEESLLLACSKSDVLAINTAISKKDGINFQCMDIFGRTPLQLAIENEDIEAEYTDLAKNPSAFSVKLLDKVICEEELNAVLDKVEGSHEDSYEQLGRLKLAVKHQEKKFVAHPSCQIRLNQLWYKDFETINRGHCIRRSAILCVFSLCYVFLGLVYLVAPTLEILRFMRSPCAKFLASVQFYLILLGLLFWSAYHTLPYRAEADITWTSVNTTKYFRIGTDGALLFRYGKTATVHYLIFIWVVGLLWKEIKECKRNGLKEHFSSILNWFDIAMLCLYSASYIARFYSIGQVCRWLGGGHHSHLPDGFGLFFHRLNLVCPSSSLPPPGLPLPDLRPYCRALCLHNGRMKFKCVLEVLLSD